MKYLLAFLLCLVPIISTAQDLNPLEEMALSIKELKYLIEEAERVSDSSERFKFEYGNMTADFAIIHSGLVAAYGGREETKHIPRQLFAEYGYVGRGEESRYIAMIRHELQALKAKALALGVTKQAGVRQFDFSFLVSDFDSMINAITVSMKGAGDQPRRFPPLRGNTH